MMPSSVLYVTDTRHGLSGWHDPSARHRCYHFADALSAESWIAAVVHIDQLTEKLAGQYRNVVFHRPKYTRRFARALQICNSFEVTVHADYDDLIFDPSLASYSPLYINGNRPLSKVKAYFADNQKAMHCFESVIVSTRSLATYVSGFKPDTKVTILPNSLPRLFQRPIVSPLPDQKYTIGYFPGSNSHSHDVEMIREALSGLFEAEPNCKLVVMGKMDRSSLPFPSRQVEFKPFVDYSLYLDQLARVNLSIAPLQRNIFNDAKSAVKLIESVAVGTPILASGNPDMEDHQNPMSALVEDSAGWLSMLVKCVRQQAGFDCSTSEHLQHSFSVKARLPVLQNLLSAAA